MVDLRPDHLEIVKRILAERVPEYQVRAFGSRARWTAKDTSDLDLVVMTDAPLGLARLADLCEAFSESDLPFRVDVLDWAATGVEFREIIEQDDAVIQQPGSTSSPGPTWRRSGMAGEMVTKPLVEVLDKIIDHRGRTPKKLGGDFSDAGVRVLSARNIKEGRIDFSTEMRHVLEKMHDQWMPVKLEVEDVLLTSEAPLGETAFLRDDANFCLGQRLFALRPNPKLVHSRYLYYALRSNTMQHRLHARATGTTAQGIRQSELLQVLLDFPQNIKEQQAIACILGALDDKIELNRRMNQTLEGIAQAIFQSWFVDFGPVRAKAAGQQPPDLAPHIADLFPDAFEASQVGEIPKGWEVALVGDVCEFAYGKALKASIRKPGDVPVMGSNGQIGWHDTPLVEGPGIVVGRKGNPGIVTWVNSDFYPIDTTFYIKPRLIWVPLIYLNYALTSLNLPHLSADSAVPGLNRNIAYMSWLLIPSRELLDVFARHTRLIMERVYQGERENHTLATLRDTLLPKLISGELRVADAERIIGRCV